MSTNKPTIKDIAREAGVSSTLVSFVMNNRIERGKQKYRVNEQTKERVLEVARRMNYKPNSAARSLRKGRSKVIGAILSDLSNLFYGIIARELEDLAHKYGYTVLFGSSDEDPEKFCDIMHSFIAKDVEGFIVVPCEGSEQCMDALIASGVPFVVIDRHHPDYDVPSIVVDNASATRHAIDILLKDGAGKIELVTYGMRVSSMTDREDAFASYMMKNGLGNPEDHIYRLGFNSVPEDAEKAVEKMLAKGTDGIILGSNVLSVAVIKALFRKGAAVQRDIKVVAFDYSNIYEVFDPPIPYIQQPLPEIACRAAEYLFELIAAKREGLDIGDMTDTFLLKATIVFPPGKDMPEKDMPGKL